MFHCDSPLSGRVDTETVFYAAYSGIRYIENRSGEGMILVTIHIGKNDIMLDYVAVTLSYWLRGSGSSGLRNSERRLRYIGIVRAGSA
jgi:hypothetical protein